MTRKIFLVAIIFLALFLRTYKFGVNPPSLSWDEASLGYNAYSILTSGKDEHGEILPVARFIAFGDYKPPGYIYADVPFIGIMGLNEQAVRAPSLLAGLVMVIAAYFLALEIFQNYRIALLAGFAVAVSPWSIHFSRAAYEAHLAAVFNMLAVYAFLVSRRKGWLLPIAAVLFALSFYTFNANRIIAPLLFIALVVLYFRSIIKNAKWLITALFITAILLIPSISYLTSPESRLRFNEVSIFTSLEPIRQANERIESDGGIWWSKILHNRRLLFLVDYLKHYSDNFSGRFLFTDGDVNPRINLQDMGELYVWDLPFLILAAYMLVIKKDKRALPLIIWILIAPIPAGTARETPHALRTISMLPTFQILVAYGVYAVYKGLRTTSGRKMTIAFAGITAVLTLSLYYFLHFYFIHFPNRWSGEWQYGYKQMVEYLRPIENSYDQIYVTNALGRPYIYFAFYDKYPASKFIAEATAVRDAYGFYNVTKLGNISFQAPKPEDAGTKLMVTTPDNSPDGYRILTTIKNLVGDPVFIVADKR